MAAELRGDPSDLGLGTRIIAALIAVLMLSTIVLVKAGGDLSANRGGHRRSA